MDNPALRIGAVQSDRPFPETFAALREEQGIGQREVSRRCLRKDGWGVPAMINALALGQVTPSMNAMASIAKALQVPPETFAEYRLGKAREALDPEVVGLKRALKTLKEFTGQPEGGDVKPLSPRQTAKLRRRRKAGRGGRAASS